MKISEKELHLKEFHELITCECGANVERYLIDKHKNTDCGLKLVNCEFCQMLFQAKSLQSHNKYCGSRTEKCDKCNKYIMLMDLKSHPCNNTAPISINTTNTTLRHSTLVCPTCLDQFELFDDLITHMSATHGLTP